VVAGDDDRVEELEQADLVQLAARVCGLGVADQSERITPAEHLEHLACVRVQAEPVTGDGA
jgi:hypothetical protein